MASTDSVDTGDGEIFFYNQRMRDSNHKDGGHGEISLGKCFEVSSNVGSALAVKETFGDKPQAFSTNSRPSVSPKNRHSVRR